MDTQQGHDITVTSAEKAEIASLQRAINAIPYLAAAVGRGAMAKNLRILDRDDERMRVQHSIAQFVSGFAGSDDLLETIRRTAFWKVVAAFRRVRAEQEILSRSRS